HILLAFLTWFVDDIRILVNVIQFFNALILLVLKMGAYKRRSYIFKPFRILYLWICLHVIFMGLYEG
ncbi:hypothetical protein L9F63_014097, partial [Diploptera punctata]